MGLFSSSNGYEYILVAVNDVSKCMEAVDLPTKNAKVVVNFVKKLIFTRFGTTRMLISDAGSHLCNILLDNLIEKYMVKHKVATAYHPTTNYQINVSNREIKQTLEKTVSVSKKD